MFLVAPKAFRCNLMDKSLSLISLTDAVIFIQ